MADDNYVSDQIMQSGTTNFASQEAEESVLYSMLTKGDDLSSALNDISEGDFYFAEYGKVFRAIKATAAKGLAVDLVTVDATIVQSAALRRNALVSLPRLQKLELACLSR